MRDVESLLSSLHEYGHALYERQIDPALERTNLGRRHVDVGPRVAEQAVGEPRRPQPRLRRGARGRARRRRASRSRRPSSTRRSSGVEPSLIRVSADPLTYPLHIILRFELELAMIDGELAVADLPGAWHDGMRRLLGLERARRRARRACRTSTGPPALFGYFPSYALGCLIAAQLWEHLEGEIGAQDAAPANGEVGPIHAGSRERPPPRSPPGHGTARRARHRHSACGRAFPRPRAQGARLAACVRSCGCRRPWALCTRRR